MSASMLDLGLSPYRSRWLLVRVGLVGVGVAAEVGLDVGRAG
jgi:hypothetical protein